MNARSFLMSFLAAALLAGGVQAAEDEADAGKQERKAVDDCIFSRSINDWQVLDNYRLIVYAPNRSHPYLVELTRPAHSLDFEVRLGFEDRNRDERFCSYGGDSVIVTGTLSDRITVRSIRKLESDEAKLMVAQAKEKDGKADESKLPKSEDMKSDKDTEKSREESGTRPL